MTMDNILITGGTGTLGREIIRQLNHTGRQISVITTKDDPGLPEGIKVIKGDIRDIDSIKEAVAGAAIIIHAASNPLNAQLVDIEGTQNLLASVNKSRLRHFIYISIAGVNNSDFPYYKVKYQVEQLIAAADIPFTILRATQFHEFVLYRMIKPYDTGSSLVVPAGLKFQPIDISDVAGKMVGLIAGGANNETITIGGPQVLAIEEMARRYLNTLKRTDELETENMTGERFDMLRSGINLCEEQAFGTKTWQQFLTSLLSNDKL